MSHPSCRGCCDSLGVQHDSIRIELDLVPVVYHGWEGFELLDEPFGHCYRSRPDGRDRVGLIAINKDDWKRSDDDEEISR
jgi:hypothetical protein